MSPFNIFSSSPLIPLNIIFLYSFFLLLPLLLIFPFKAQNLSMVSSFMHFILIYFIAGPFYFCSFKMHCHLQTLTLLPSCSFNCHFLRKASLNYFNQYDPPAPLLSIIFLILFFNRMYYSVVS